MCGCRDARAVRVVSRTLSSGVSEGSVPSEPMSQALFLLGILLFRIRNTDCERQWGTQGVKEAWAPDG